MSRSIAVLPGTRAAGIARWRRRLVALGGGIVLVLLLVADRAMVALPMTATSPLVPLARLFDLVLVAGALVLGHALGARVLRALGLALAPVEHAAVATALGLGVAAYALLALGLVGLYRPPVLLVGTLGLAALVWRDLAATAAALVAGAWRLPAAFRGRSRGALAVAAMLTCASVLVLLGALTPPHHFDPLAYHLVAPQRFLRTGWIAPLDGIPFANLPFTVELLYGAGLAAGSEVFGQLLHVAFAGLTAAALWALARRDFEPATAWLAVGVFLGTPLVLVWARVADIDLALSCFLLLTLLAALRAYAGEDAPRRWLLLAGVFAGLALGTKYQALFAVPPLGVALAIDGLWCRRRGARAVLGDAAVFWLATLVVASPWYLKNWLLLGNPLWPLFFGGRGLSPLTRELESYYARGFALSPRTLTGYLALPLRAYTRGDIEQRLVVLSPLYLLTPAVAFLPRRRAVVYALVLAGALLVGWALGFQELRYLLPACAPLSLVTAYPLRAFQRRRWLGRLVMPGLLGAALLTFLLVGLHVGADRPLAVLLGLESRDAYLRRSVTTGPTYRATAFLAGRLRPGETVRFFNDAQVYYVPFAVEPDHLNVNLIALTSAHPEPSDALAALRAEHVTYLLVNEANIRYAERFDPEGRLARARQDFARLTPRLDLVYRDGPPERPLIAVYRVP